MPCALSEREINLHCAAVYEREADARRARDPSFAATLMTWAANARSRAAAFTPIQSDLFSEVR